MSTPCQKCDQLQDVPSGSAPIRPEFRQPTMYDHMDSFCKFKQAKAHAEKLRAAEEERLKLNPKFVELSMAGKEEEVLAKRMPKLRSTLKQSHGDDVRQEQCYLKPTASLTTISRTPIYCPVSKCGQTIGSTSVLSHFLLDHTEGLVVGCHNLYSGGRCILLFNRNMFAFRENVCLGVLPYGGIEDAFESRPALRGICRQNTFLSKAHAHLENHLPILVMVCLTSMEAMLLDKQMAEKLIDPDNKANHILVIWLASVQTTKPIHCTITAFDEAMTSSRSTIIRVRGLEATQNPDDFLGSDTNYLMMNQGELDILSENGAKSIHVEIKIHEFNA